MMEQGIQTNFPNKDLQEAGCHYFVLMKYLEIKHGIEFTYKSLMTYFYEALKAGYMGYDPNDKKRGVGDNCNVLDAPALLNMVLDKKVYSEYRRNIMNRPEKDICIQRLVKPGYTHFLLDVHGATYDPLDPYRPAAATYRIDSYRILL